MAALPDPSSPLNEADATEAFRAILNGTVSDEAIASFLIAMTDRGETAVEIAAAANEMRCRMIAVTAPANAIDVCGTGGDGHHTLNVSTAVAIVVASCGIPVAKNGNRAASSKAGTADTVEALGLDLNRASQKAERSLREIGICFVFAQKHNPVLVRMEPIRKAIGKRTIFNLLGPLINPATVKRQLVGVARPAYVPIYAQVLSALGTERAMIVSGDEGLDELSLAGGNDLAEVTTEGLVAMRRVTAGDAGLPSAPIEAIRGGDARHNAAALRRLLQGESGAYRDAVMFNAAAALQVADRVTSLADGVEEAAKAIDEGRAEALLDDWIAFT